MKISEEGLALVKHFEGLSEQAYLDPVGIWTIGYGHTGEVAKEGARISAEEAEALLEQDLSEAENVIERRVGASLSQHEFDALVSFVFNVGGPSFLRSTLLRKLLGENRTVAADELLRWNKGTVDGRKVVLPGLARRRKAERHLFTTGEVRFFDRGVVDPDVEEASSPSGDPARSDAGNGYIEDFAALVGQWSLKHFRPSELLTMGGAHSSPGSPAFGENRRPDRALWPNIEPTIKTLDMVRTILDAPIRITSAYRSDAYNRLIGGARQSQHKAFRAIDFYAASRSGPSHWASILRELRADGMLGGGGGIGVYDTFVHVDCRPERADW